MATFTIEFTDQEKGVVSMHSTAEPKIGNVEDATPAQIVGLTTCEAIEAILTSAGVETERVRVGALKHEF